MAGNKTVIEINGKKYDADTGQIIGQRSSVAPPKIQKRSVDGIVKPKKGTMPPTKAKKTTANKIHQKSQKSKTLNRAATTKPEDKPQIKAKAAHAEKAPESNTAQSGKDELAKNVNSERESRAKSQLKSPLIAKFARPSSSAKVEIDTPPSVAPVAPAPQAEAPPASHQMAQSVMSAAPAEVEEPRSQKSRKSRSPSLRPASMFASVAVILLLAGYVTYLNIPRLALRVAASRAGFEASLPAYSPSGYDFSGPIAYNTGQITIQFDSNTNESSYNIVQRESQWDSQSLLDNYVINETQDYLTFQERGLTVYIYDGSSASWVDSGVWYTIEGDSELSSEQLLKIASSL